MYIRKRNFFLRDVISPFTVKFLNNYILLHTVIQFLREFNFKFFMGSKNINIKIFAHTSENFTLSDATKLIKINSIYKFSTLKKFTLNFQVDEFNVLRVA